MEIFLDGSGSWARTKKHYFVPAPFSHVACLPSGAWCSLLSLGCKSHCARRDFSLNLPLCYLIWQQPFVVLTPTCVPSPTWNQGIPTHSPRRALAPIAAQFSQGEDDSLFWIRNMAVEPSDCLCFELLVWSHSLTACVFSERIWSEKGARGQGALALWGLQCPRTKGQRCVRQLAERTGLPRTERTRRRQRIQVSVFVSTAQHAFFWRRNHAATTSALGASLPWPFLFYSCCLRLARPARNYRIVCSCARPARLNY